MRIFKFVMRHSLVLLLWLSGPVQAEEYFLDSPQRAELIMDGRITGRDGARYDIWIVPGYHLPARQIKEGWHAAHDDLHWYSKPEFFPDMIDTTRKVMRFARQDVLGDFALQGTGDAWYAATVAARERVRRRVFGWQFAWPWALLEGSAHSVVRVGGGVPVGTALWAGGAVVTPVAYTSFPLVMSAAHGLGQGTALPLVSAGWNTVIAPPLALVGQQPAPERADGWWMKRLADPNEADIRSRVAQWQRGWQDSPALSEAQAKLKDADGRHKETTDRLRAELVAEEASWARERGALTDTYQRQLLEQALAALPVLRGAMAAAGYELARLQAQREALRDELIRQGLDAAMAERVLSVWLDGMPTGLPPGQSEREPDRKTDPLLQVLENLPPR